MIVPSLRRVTAAFPEWALTPFETCGTRLRDIGRVHHASLIGLRAVTTFPEYAPQLFSRKLKRGLNDVLSRIEQSIESITKAAKTAKVDLRQDHFLVNASAVVSLWSALEVAIEDFLIAWMLNQRSALNVPVLQKIKISLAEYDRLDSEERMRVLLSELERAVIGKQGVDCFEPLLDTFGLSGKVDQPTKTAIYELQHVRNVVVHRGGRADRRFVKGCPGWDVKVGQTVRVKAKHCWDYQRAVAGYVLTVAERVAAHLGDTDSPELARLRKLLRT